MHSGILIIDKPTGLTSHDVVARVRRIFHTKKVGHAGTLDPDASGVLVLCTGDATRVLEYLSAEDKKYTGEVVFGIGTNTDDQSGSVTKESDAAFLTEPVVSDAAHQFLGQILQRPPQFSAVHVGGRRAYELARQGVPVEIPSRTVTIQVFDVFDFVPGSVARANFRVWCSKGTYIRSLCRDLGDRLGVPAHMGGLRRVQSGLFCIDDAVTLADLESTDDPQSFLLDVTYGLPMPKLQVPLPLCLRLAQGQTIQLPNEAGIDDTVSVAAALGPDGALAAIMERRETSDSYILWKPKKVFWKREAP